MMHPENLTTAGVYAHCQPQQAAHQDPYLSNF